MGGTYSTFRNAKHLLNNIKYVVVGQKRKREESDTEDEMNKVIDLAMHTPKR